MLQDADSRRDAEDDLLDEIQPLAALDSGRAFGRDVFSYSNKILNRAVHICLVVADAAYAWRQKLAFFFPVEEEAFD